MELFDISRALSSTTAVWPGDRPVERTLSAKIDDGASVNVGHLSTSLHAATHVDAPYHVSDEGCTAEDLPLSALIGPATVVEVGRAKAIRSEHLSEVAPAERLLFKTPASAIPDDEWPRDIVPLDPSLTNTLDAWETVLVGTDAPSIDPLDSKTLPAHHALRDAGIVHLEGLSLNGVSPGAYRLFALPLKLPGADAAPVRAVLAPA